MTGPAILGIGYLRGSGGLIGGNRMLFIRESVI